MLWSLIPTYVPYFPFGHIELRSVYFASSLKFTESVLKSFRSARGPSQFSITCAVGLQIRHPFRF